MAQQWRSKPKAKSRSPAPPRTPTTPSQFFPPSYFAAAAGVPYPPGATPTQLRTPSMHSQQNCSLDAHTFSSNASCLLAECSPRTNNQGRIRRKYQLVGDLGLLESHLLPTLTDTVERMTRPPSQMAPNSPSRSVPDYSPGVARTPSTSSQSSSSSSVGSGPSAVALQASAIHPTSGKQFPLRSPSNAHPEQPFSLRPNPRSILKSHTISEQHMQVGQAQLEDHLSTDHGRRKGRSPTSIPVPLEPLPPESRTRQMPTTAGPKLDGSLRAGRARSRTDPGAIPKALPSTHGRSTQQQNPQLSGIPRRAGVPPSPATSRVSTTPQISNSGSETGGMLPTPREKRRLFVTNAEITTSSSSENQAPLTRYVKPKPLSRADSQSSTESQIRPPRFGLGLGLSGINESKNPTKLSQGQRWVTKIPNDDAAPLRCTNSPGNKKQLRHGIPRRRDRSPAQNPQVDGVDGQRQQRELLLLVHKSSGCDSLPSVSDESEEYLRSEFEDSESEYSPAEDDEGVTPVTSTKRESKFEPTRSTATARRTRIYPTGSDIDLPICKDDQFTPKASSTPSFALPMKGQQRDYGVSTAQDAESLETGSSTLASDQDSSSMDHPVSQAVVERHSSDLSRIMAASIAAAVRQRQAFGIDSANLDDCQSLGLPSADSDLSFVGGDGWLNEYDELATGSLLQSINLIRSTDGREYTSQRSSLSSNHAQSSVSQDSMHSTPNSTTRRSARDIVIAESPPIIPTVRDRQWKTLQRHILDSYGELEARRQRFVWELTESEHGFVTQLQNMIQLFVLPLRVKDTRTWVSGIPGDVMKLFDWLDDIMRVHAQLSSNLTSRQIVDHPRLQNISETFRSFVPRLEIYQPYLVKLECTASMIDDLIHEGKNDLGDFIKLQEASQHCQGWSLEKYLIEPINRLAQYPEVFRSLLQLTPKSHPDYMSTLSLFHAAKLTIRVLSEVKDREDAYEFVKMACSGIKGISPMHLVHRERRMLVRGPLTCVRVSDDQACSSLEPLAEGDYAVPRSDVSPASQLVRRTDKLSKAVHVWRGRSNSVKSTASTAVSFSTAPSSFDVYAQPVAVATMPVVRVESEPLDVEAMVFTDLVLLATRLSPPGGRVADPDVCDDLEVLDGFGLARVVSVLDEIDHRGCITLDLAPVTPRALEEGYCPSSGPVVTVALSLPRATARTESPLAPEEPASTQAAMPDLADWLAPLHRTCQYTLGALASPGPGSTSTHVAMLVDRVAQAADPPKRQPTALSILKAGLPLPKSPSMQMDASGMGLGGGTEQLEREERGWWSKRFHEVFAELRAQDVGGTW